MSRTLLQQLLIAIIARASRWAACEGRPARHGASRPPAARSDTAELAGPRSPARAAFLEIDAADQVLDEHLAAAAEPCTLTGCPRPATRRRNGVPWCDEDYESGEAVLHLEAAIRA